VRGQGRSVPTSGTKVPAECQSGRRSAPATVSFGFGFKAHRARPFVAGSRDLCPGLVGRAGARQGEGLPSVLGPRGVYGGCDVHRVDGRGEGRHVPRRLGAVDAGAAFVSPGADDGKLSRGGDTDEHLGRVAGGNDGLDGDFGVLVLPLSDVIEQELVFVRLALFPILHMGRHTGPPPRLGRV
jgi:hypothetical protein